ncbi:hypothetical protein EYF80_049739 [Liparis tanakae]|uniref:Uncharacterized protein n=1 Tax=Liparis tanakae TaxID=230148 RepID=A0A4Z2FGP6_9TELE|nr:hypothetical protein EYF80_049739 [Liparis tanakae]
MESQTPTMLTTVEEPRTGSMWGGMPCQKSCGGVGRVGGWGQSPGYRGWLGTKQSEQRLTGLTCGIHIRLLQQPAMHPLPINDTGSSKKMAQCTFPPPRRLSPCLAQCFRDHCPSQEMLRI